MIAIKLVCPVCGKEVKRKSKFIDEKTAKMTYVCDCGYDARTNSVEKCTLKSLKMEN